ncbi:maltose alpha-D-glucosyltransferase/alpha-amylase [Pontibacter ummariensis]|uniref:Maltokinase n=1 Tax=Pontibacter ummariensis TaxID=1610492 RepID=A0A239IR55_9BACT|nr:maltose alpha-D-glucosyltransferase [Pontibacter ummariensis]PRY09730.1 maltose alpha-D-glucosyltransferase/alpha-amylase [Pontibacter ummariensis]SNS94904.1 maltose alpha-D-glucosyltransferase/ alpha-amylase [Pontibacter ummariensis]
MADNKDLLDDNTFWYKDAIIYELHIKAFKDGNGDGIGDFKGLMQKLDYLEDLGVTAIWLLPFYPSPLRDDGYDIADYFSINPSYGNMQDFKVFVREAHKRGLKVITELVINHTSDQHPWFQRARKAKRDSKYRDYYVWTDDPTKYKDVRIIFTDTEQSNWTWDPVAQQYYWHRFFSHQPDLNYDNLEVQKEVFKVLDYWLDLGVDGFRLDAVPYLFEREGTNGENLPETHDFLKKLRAHVDEKYTGKLLLAEANMWPEDSASYFGNGDECHMNYHFPIMPRLFMSVKMEDRYPIIDIFNQTPEIPESCQWAMFLRNHDELTLEMVTDEERDYMYKVYTKDPQARINLGIRHRLAPLLGNDRSKIELMNVLLFSMRGTPVVYYGDEIGMGDNYYLGDRDGVRTPMQWNEDRNAGFSSANPQRLYLPVIIDPEYKYESVNVETQNHNANSLLWWMRRIINMRKRYKAFGRGTIKFLSPSNAKVLAFVREYENETILVIANLSRFPEAVELDLHEYRGRTPVEVFSKNKFPNIKDDDYLFTLSGHGYYWMELQAQEVGQGTGEQQRVVQLGSLKEALDGKTLKALEGQVLPSYVYQRRWFGGKARTVQRMQVVNNMPLPLGKTGASLLFIEVSYNEGLPEMYQLPVGFATGEEEQELRDASPNSVIARVAVDGKDGILYDALYSEEFRQMLLQMMVKRKRVSQNGAELIGQSSRNVTDIIREVEGPLTSKILAAEQSNTSVVYDNALFLKVYRKLDRTMNPDVEIVQMLTEKVGFENVPRYLGSLEQHEENKQPMVLVMLQELVPNQGDAWSYIGDSLKRLYERLLTQTDRMKVKQAGGSLARPLPFSAIPEEVQLQLGGAHVERVELLGLRTAEMHLALGSITDDKDFNPEEFSLHYQRSLYSSLTSLVRSNFDSLQKHLPNLPDSVRGEAEEVLHIREEVLERLKMIFSRKIDTLKIRTHGDYHLGQVLFTGKDFYIIDFEGEPARSFSERRLKRSALRDVAGMIRSFHYAAYSALFQQEGLRREDVDYLEAWAEQWYQYASGFFMHNYLGKTQGTGIVPAQEEDFEILIHTFLLEKAIYELGYELNNRPDWVLIPIRGIKYIMRKYKNG